jgi:hypothetical protein
MFMITNTVTGAVSVYEGLAPNSMCELNGQFFVMTSTGVQALDADNDNGTQIDARIKFGVTNLGIAQQKRISDFYAGMRASGDMTLRIYTDENAPNEYTLSPNGVPTLKQRRVTTGKGVRGKYWQFELENTNGCAFDFDSFDIAVAETDRRI